MHLSLHRCDQGCTCPIHNVPLLYAPYWREHACPDPECRYAHGYERALYDYSTCVCPCHNDALQTRPELRCVCREEHPR